MRLAFYAPFKPLGHPKPSGDLTIATGLTDFLRREHQLTVASTLRARWIYWKPWLWPQVALERQRAVARTKTAGGCDVWLSYHTYYKAPDLLGPACAKALGAPYAVFQGIYSTKRRKKALTAPGFYLNRAALKAARVVFTNKKSDHENLVRIIPKERLHYVAPGIFPEQFERDESRRAQLRAAWGAEEETPVILSAAMFRDDVKTRGLVFLLKALGALARQGMNFKLALAGDGVTRPRLEKLAATELPGRVTFLGLVPRSELPLYYSAADVFAFPGIRESLGMVYLEAQSCGLPVVAFDGWGIPEVVEDGVTGLLTPPFDEAAFAQAVQGLLEDGPRRQAMGRAAAAHVRARHDLNRNYGVVEDILAQLARETL